MPNVTRRTALASIAAATPSPALAASRPSPAPVLPDLAKLITAWDAAHVASIAAADAFEAAEKDWNANKPFIVAKIGKSNYEVDRSDTDRAIREQHMRLRPAYDLPDDLKQQVRRFAFRQAL